MSIFIWKFSPVQIFLAWPAILFEMIVDPTINLADVKTI